MNRPFRVGRTVYLRSIGREDTADYQAWMNDVDVWRHLQFNRPVTREEESRFVERAMAMDDPAEINFAIVRRRGDLLLGATGLHGIDMVRRSAGFGIQIGRKAEWGKGYGTEASALVVDYAFRDLNLNRVWLHVYEFNERGIRAYERIGFKREAVLRQECFRDGRYYDVHVMGILRREWSRRTRAASTRRKRSTG